MRTVVTRHYRRPWQVKWSPTREHHIENTDGRLVAFGFESMWNALGWAAGK